jgi:hypothetical protein
MHSRPAHRSIGSETWNMTSPSLIYSAGDTSNRTISTGDTTTFGKMKIVLCVALVLGTASAALASNEKIKA